MIARKEHVSIFQHLELVERVDDPCHQVIDAVSLLVEMESSWLFAFFSMYVAPMVCQALAEPS